MSRISLWLIALLVTGSLFLTSNAFAACAKCAEGADAGKKGTCGCCICNCSK